MIVVVFRSRLRADVDIPALEAAAARMFELASAMPGFVSYKDFAAEDGEFLSLVEFADAASVAAWGRHPEHVAVQERGRREFMSDYRIQVCMLFEARAFAAGREDARIVAVLRTPQTDTGSPEAARGMPGFLSDKVFTAADGEQARIVEFADDAALAALREHGFAPDYRIQICAPLREHVFPT